MFARRFLAFLMLATASAFATGALAQELAGTSWRLVEIVSMNDTIDRPGEPARYTLEFGENGLAAIQADCNRGNGTWSSDGGQLRFGPVASTRAMCPPGSISDKFLAQFEGVRNYLIVNGNLFLSTMADGSIIEFEPLPDIAATVLGENIRPDDSEALQRTVLTKLFDRFAAENGIEAETAEIETYLEKMRQGLANEGLASEEDLSEEEAAQLAVMRQRMARSVIRQWKINRALYRQYGGRIIYQQLGPEPLDAYRRFLEARERDGAFRIYDDSMKSEFWRYFTDESIHDFMEPGGEDERRAFATPPWL